VEYTTISQAALKSKGTYDEPTEQLPLHAVDDDVEVDNDIDDDNLNVVHDDVEVDNDVDDDNHDANDNNIDVDHVDDALMRFNNINDILVTVEFALCTLVVEELHVVSSNEPASFTEAERSPSWRKVMMEEMMSIEENDTCSLIDLPPSRKLIMVKWVIKVKWDEHRVVCKHKACLMVKGYAQWHNIDYDEAFVPVAQLDSVRLLITLTTHEGWEVHHMDVKLVFLNSGLHDEVYVE
jgi:hypothetical protein